MSAPDSPLLSRRDALAGGIATLASLLLQLPAQAKAKNHRQDPRWAMTDRLCDLVIPDTDTPGASKAGVAAFVLLAMDHGLRPLDAPLYAQVKDALDAAAGGNFMSQPRARQFVLLSELDRRSYASTPPPPGAPAARNTEAAWQAFKTGIIAGYYTSEIGASKELVWDPVPGSRENFTLTDDFRMPANLTIASSL
jgi:hypothetical protein